MSKRASSKQVIRIGPAGWSYKDWETTVYPMKPGKRFDPLEYLARFFDTIEINSSFYRPPSSSTAKSWVDRIADHPAFNFTAKLHRVFTHERGKATAKDEKDFHVGIEPLVKANKLGGLLLQFPWSFKNTDEERLYLTQLIKKFEKYPLVLEVRHSSWNIPEIYEWLEDEGVAMCNIDQPVFSKSIRPNAMATAKVGYVRLHGRNYKNWFRDKAPRDERYNYLYSHDELEPWVTRIKSIASKTRETYVVTNNHFRGQAVVNALEIKATIEGKQIAAPQPLLKLYPRLEESAYPDESSNPGETDTKLFR
jgi:uncharacterized protein YecE (DUF72 family)